MWKTGSWRVHGSMSQFCCQLLPPQSAPGSIQLMNKPKNEAQIKAQWQSKRTIKLAGKCSKKQSKNQASVSVPFTVYLMEPKLAKHICNQLSFQRQTELAGVKLWNLTADDLQLLPPHLPDQGGETDPSIVCLVELYLILNLNGVVQPCVYILPNGFIKYFLEKLLPGLYSLA